MNLDIKEEAKHLLITEEKKGVLELTIKDNSKKLGEILNFLPHGIIDKTVTGIGATTLEIYSKRNSIIVVPLKIIAASKVEQHPENCYYVGSAINNFQTFGEEAFDLFLTNDKIPYKNVIVVAESLPKVIKTIGEDVYKNYFLLIDEINTIQEDSKFRETIENCLDIYLKFPPQSRAMVTATMINFSHPEIAKEQKTTINYEEQKPNLIDEFIMSYNTLGVCIDLIEKLLKEHQDAKIVIAYNSVIGSKILAEELVLSNPENAKNVSILCSKSNKKKAGVFYAELTGLKYPSKINFITAAYFSGYDIEEQYYLINLIDENEIFSKISINAVRQIAGRAREGLHKHYIVYPYSENEEELIEYVDEKQLLDLAKVELKSIECIENNFKEYPFFKTTMLDIHSAVIDNGGYKGFKLIRRNIENEINISYFNIDSYLEHQKTQYEEHASYNSFLKSLSNSFSVLHVLNLQSHHEFSKVKESNLDVDQSIKTAIENLQNITTDNEAYYLSVKAEDNIQKKVYFIYDKLSKFYYEKETLLDKIAEVAKKNSKAFNILKSEVTHKSLPPYHPLKKFIFEYFKEGVIYKSSEILELLNKVHALASTNHKKIDSELKAVEIFNCYFETVRKKYNNGYLLKNYIKQEDYLDTVINRDENNIFSY
ncbi:hypothetical protein FYC62_14950 [Pedobacter aquae]|uniref:Uncharacterized protein n=1 Tax=Pedobacter aquae TaxID=2605747 RepID=A0A5C0VJX7_9SPHI|nr:hypothetical protein [Pedobacter aquae]QEK52816.1 hypothetical protein FYC62_14950 [Pedobacter aquae]